MHRAARPAKTGFHRNKQPNRTDGESAENSEEKAFWMLTCSAHNLWAAVPHQWYESGIFERCHLLTSPLNRQLGRGREVGRPPSFCRQISELDQSVVMRAPNKCRNYLPQTLPKILPAASPQTTNLSASYARRPSRYHTYVDFIGHFTSKYPIWWLTVSAIVQTYNKFYFTLSSR